MKNFLQQLAWKMSVWMQGRYGPDKLNMFLICVAFLLSILSGVFNSYWLNLPCYLLLGFGIYRLLSKNISARYAENQKYLELSRPVRQWLNLQKMRWNGRKEWRYFRCSKCGQISRVPKGQGKIIITCKKCRNEFKRVA